jgi:RimJ/RimL family protein N-acetyltransferase
MNGGDMMMVGWSLIPSARGQGYGTEAALLLRDLLFCQYPQVKLLMAHTVARHTISRRVMATLGMTQYHMPWRAQLRTQWWYREWHQVVSYFITRKTWTRMQGAGDD